MREKELALVCIVALVIVFACVQPLPETTQQEVASFSSWSSIHVSSGPWPADDPCGGGGGDEGGGPAPR